MFAPFLATKIIYKTKTIRRVNAVIRITITFLKFAK